MLKSRDFYLMKVYDSKGKYLGVIDDIAIDFYNSKVTGFYISHFSLFNKRNFIHVEDILSLQEEMLVKKLENFKGLKFKEIKYMDIYSEKNVMEGVLEDIIIDRQDYSIKGLVVTSGVFDKMFKGKKIFLLHSCILCDKYIIHINDENVNFISIPHNLGGNFDDKKI